MEEIKVLDHGYVKAIEFWGSDERIIEAARMSTNKGFQGWGQGGDCLVFTDEEWAFGAVQACDKKTKGCLKRHVGDEKLLKYLWDNKHYTPFEMAGMTIEVQAPIFVFREWHRHRTQSYNELSARYTELPALMYIPSYERLTNGKQATLNKQSSEAGLTEEEVWNARYIIDVAHSRARAAYEDLLKLGVSREIARGVLPVNQYSRMRASANLRNWLHFATLRLGGGAQFEIRQYAEVVASMIEGQFPRTYALWKGV